MRGRLYDATRSKARRGELRVSVPVGYVWDREMGLGLDPGMRLREAIRLIFARFRELGSARQVLLSLAADQLHFPRPSDGKRMIAFDWTPIRYCNVISVLKNAALDDVRVEFDAAIVEEADKPFPMVQAVAELLGDSGFAGDARQLMLEPGLERHDERFALLQAHPTPLVGAHSPDRLLDRVERSDPFERLAGDRRSALGLIEDPAAQMRPAESERDPAVEPPGGDRLVSGVAVALDDALLFVEHLQASPRSPRAERDGALHERIRYSSRRPPDRLLHHAVVIQIEGASYRLREHADLLPENVRFKLNAAANPIPPTLKRRGRPPKNGGADHPLG